LHVAIEQVSKKHMAKITEEHYQRIRRQAERAHRKYGHQIPELIAQLAGPTQEEHDRAFELLSRMAPVIVSELLAALEDPELDPLVEEEIVAILGVTGDDDARRAVWHFLQQNPDDPDRVSMAALSLAGLGDERGRPYLLQGLESPKEEIVANSVSGLILLGQPEDIHTLRQIHRQHRTNREIRYGVANAVLSILGETNQSTFNRTLDEIRTNFSDRDLWADIWAILESRFGTVPPPVH